MLPGWRCSFVRTSVLAHASHRPKTGRAMPKPCPVREQSPIGNRFYFFFHLQARRTFAFPAEVHGALSSATSDCSVQTGDFLGGWSWARPRGEEGWTGRCPASSRPLVTHVTAMRHHAYRPSTGAPLVTARVKREQRNFAGTRGSARAVTSATCRPSNQSSVLCIGGFRRRRSLSGMPACPCH